MTVRKLEDLSNEQLQEPDVLVEFSVLEIAEELLRVDKAIDPTLASAGVSWMAERAQILRSLLVNEVDEDGFESDPGHSTGWSS